MVLELAEGGGGGTADGSTVTTTARGESLQFVGWSLPSFSMVEENGMIVGWDNGEKTGAVSAELVTRATGVGATILSTGARVGMTVVATAFLVRLVTAPRNS